MRPKHFAAIDLGAESGRVLLAELHDDRLDLRVIHQFPTPVVEIAGSLRWDVAAIFQQIVAGLRLLARDGASPESIAVDSWGVDYVLLHRDEPLLTLPFHYRDPRVVGAIERVEPLLSRHEIFSKTGIQFVPINTIYQLYDDTLRRPEVLAQADGMLLIADYFNWLLCGVARGERTLASTTQLYDPRSGCWATDLGETLHIPARLFPALVSAGAILGPLRPELREATGLPDVQVIATCSHDTACAVAAVPAQSQDWAYISSGTWSLMGIEIDAPLITPDVQRLNFTNEVGFGNSIRLLKNLVGLWPLQQCKAEWKALGHDLDYAELTCLAAEATPRRSIIDLRDPRFLLSGQMLAKVTDFCRERGQPVPESPAQVTRCILESLALEYRRTLDELRTLCDAAIDRIHIVGGGSRNELLNQLTADACGVDVLAGPVEATGIGNALVQAIALGHVGDLPQARRIVASSFAPKRYTPCR